MANVDGAYGLALHQDNSQSNLVTCLLPAGDSTATFVGDAVKLTDEATARIDGGPLALPVAQAAATDPIYGVIMGISQILPSGQDLGRRHRPASTAMYCYVKPAHPLDVYRIQADDDTETLGLGSIGSNADIIVGSGDTATGMSGMELDSNTAAATAGLQLKIVGFVERPGNEAASAQQDVLVTINQNQSFNDSGVAGVAE